MGMMNCRTIIALLLATGLGACATSPSVSLPPEPASEWRAGLVPAAIGETVTVDGPRVTPLEVLADSRCPQEVHCVWEGEVRLSVRIDLGARSEVREITSRKPIHVADGALELVEVRPDRVVDKAIAPSAYRFAFRFMGGL